jgi:hypothetical protein
MRDWINLVIALIAAYTAWTNYQTSKINRKMAMMKKEESDKEKAAPADTGSDH